MSWVEVERENCKRDGACVAVCASLAIRQDEEGYPVEASEQRCIQCGHCVSVCPSQAIRITTLPEEPFLPAIKEPIEPALFDSFAGSLRSVREFREEPIGRELFGQLFEVGRRAPTAVNRQGMHWIAVDGKEKVRRVAEAVFAGLDPKMRSPRATELFNNGQDFLLRNAPSLAVVCAPAESDWGLTDAAIAVATMALAAQARGLGSCWAGFLVRVAQTHEPLNQALGVPEGKRVCGGLMLGWGKYKYKRIPPRQPLSVSWL